MSPYRKINDNLLILSQDALIKLVDGYDSKEDFTVVLQPFLEDYIMPCDVREGGSV